MPTNSTYVYPYSLKDDSDTLNPFTLILRAKKKKKDFIAKDERKRHITFTT